MAVVKKKKTTPTKKKATTKKKAAPKRKLTKKIKKEAAAPPIDPKNNKSKIVKENFLAICEEWRIDPDEPIPLTIAEEKWCQIYFRCHNKSEAARYAYPKQKAPGVYGATLSKKPEIRLRLAQLWYLERQKFNLSPSDVLSELGRLSSIDIRDFIYIDENGNEQLCPNYDGRAVKSIKRYVDDCGKQKIELTFWNKDRALENFGRHHKLFTDNLEADVSGKIQVNISNEFSPNGKKSK